MHVSFRCRSLTCSEILVSPSICTKIRTWRFHRTEEVSNNFPVSSHITQISMAISANLNLGRDTDHKSTKLVCDHPLDTCRTRSLLEAHLRPGVHSFVICTIISNRTGHFGSYQNTSQVLAARSFLVARFDTR